MKKLLAVFLSFIILIYIPGCGKDSESAEQSLETPTGIMIYHGDYYKQGFTMNLQENTFTYELKYASNKYVEARRKFMELYNYSDTTVDITKEKKTEFLSKIVSETRGWETTYGKEYENGCRQYWFIDIYYGVGVYETFCGYDVFPDNYGNLSDLIKEYSGLFFPKDIEDYYPADNYINATESE